MLDQQSVIRVTQALEEKSIDAASDATVRHIMTMPGLASMDVAGSHYTLRFVDGSVVSIILWEGGSPLTGLDGHIQELGVDAFISYLVHANIPGLEGVDFEDDDESPDWNPEVAHLTLRYADGRVVAMTLQEGEHTLG